MTFVDLNSPIKLYIYDTNNYTEVQLLPKIIFKNITNGKLYTVENNLLTRINSGLKFDEAIVNKYVNNGFTETSNVNLFKSSSRVITQNVSNKSGFIKFNPQPPENSRIIENKCVNVITGDGWLFNSDNISQGNSSTVIFEYSKQGIIYNLLYNIIRKVQSNLIAASSLFNGSIDFGLVSDAVLDKYQLTNLVDDGNNVITMTYNSLIGDINNLGEFISPSDGLFSITVVINYKYNPIVTSITDLNNIPFYSLNYDDVSGDELTRTQLSITCYNTETETNYSLVSNGTITLNTIVSLEQGDKIVIIYNNNNIQSNVIYDNCYFNIVMLS